MDESKTQVSRREILKALAAGGGALAGAAFLSAKWTKPLVEAGVLPAHAQSSCPYIGIVSAHGPCFRECPEGAANFVSFDWSPADVPDNVAILYGGVTPQVISQNIGAGHGEIFFNPNLDGAQSTNGELALVWGNCVVNLSWVDTANP